MTRVRRRTTRARTSVLDHEQWFELMVFQDGAWQHFRSDAEARTAWFDHRDELLEGLNDGPHSGGLRFPAGLARFEAPRDLSDAAYRAADANGLEYAAAETAARAIWLVGLGLLDPAWIDTALSKDEPMGDEFVDYGQRRIGSGPYRAAALRVLLAVDGPWRSTVTSVAQTH